MKGEIDRDFYCWAWMTLPDGTKNVQQKKDRCGGYHWEYVNE